MAFVSKTSPKTFTYCNENSFIFRSSGILFWIQNTCDKTYKKPNDSMTLVNFHSNYPVICKEGITYSQTLYDQYDTIWFSPKITPNKKNSITTQAFFDPCLCINPHHQKHKKSSSVLAVICFCNWHNIYQSFVRHRRIIYKHNQWELLYNC